MDPDPNSIGLQVLLIVVLTLVNAYFAASEMAIVSVSKTKIHHLSEQGNKKAKLVEELLEFKLRLLWLVSLTQQVLQLVYLLFLQIF